MRLDELTERINIDGPDKLGDTDFVPMFVGVRACFRSKTEVVIQWQLGLEPGMDVRAADKTYRIKSIRSEPDNPRFLVLVLEAH